MWTRCKLHQMQITFGPISNNLDNNLDNNSECQRDIFPSGVLCKFIRYGTKCHSEFTDTNYI